MSISLYDITIPVFIRNLKVLSALLQKGRAHIEASDAAEATLIEARLIGDMQALPFQIQRVSDAAKFVAVRVGGLAPVVMADTEKTLDDLQRRIQATITLLETLDTRCMDGKEADPVIVKTPAVELTFTAKEYILQYGIPNFYFHICIAYALLRKEGVAIGKMDYLGASLG